MNQSFFGFWHRRRSVLLACGCACGALASLPVRAADGARDPVTVVKKPVEAEETLFEPPLPPPAEQARTSCTYTVGVDLHAQAQSGEMAGGKMRVTARITGIEAVLTMKVVMELPRQVPLKLRNHELGHRKIGEFFYTFADDRAKLLFGPCVGQSIAGTGATFEAAQQDAIHRASKLLAKAYLAQINARSGRVQDLYDEITAHGTKDDVEEDVAILQAMAQWKAEEAKAKEKEKEKAKAQVPAPR